MPASPAGHVYSYRNENVRRSILVFALVFPMMFSCLLLQTGFRVAGLWAWWVWGAIWATLIGGALLFAIAYGIGGVDRLEIRGGVLTLRGLGFRWAYRADDIQSAKLLPPVEPLASCAPEVRSSRVLRLVVRGRELEHVDVPFYTPETESALKAFLGPKWPVRP
jgi:hypothetical protein